MSLSNKKTKTILLSFSHLSYIFFLLIIFLAETALSTTPTEKAHLIELQLIKAQSAFNKKEYKEAYCLYKEALDASINTPLTPTNLHQQSLLGFSKASVALSLKYASNSEYNKAKKIVTLAIKEPYCSTYQPALILANKLSSPQKSKTQFFDNIKNSSDLISLFDEAEHAYQLGSLDLSFKDYEKILVIDPNNRAARLGMELIDKKREEDSEIMAAEKKQSMIADVEKSWELPPPTRDLPITSTSEELTSSSQHHNELLRKINEIIISDIDFFDLPISEAINQIKKKASLSDNLETDPNKKGVNIVLQLTSLNTPKEPKISLSLSKLPLKEILTYISKQADLVLRIEPYAIVLISQKDFQEQLITKEYKIPSSIISSFSSFSQTQSEQKNLSPTYNIEQFSPKEFLVKRGVIFPKGSIAYYLASNNTLIVKNTQSNLDLVDAIISSSFEQNLAQIEIEARFLEVKENSLNEKGVDWLLGSFQLPYGSGITGTDLPHSLNNQQSRHPLSIGKNPMGAFASALPNASPTSTSINANALDAALLGTSASPATEALALAGILTNPQFQVVLRALNQHKGINLLSAPKVTVSSGRRAIINVAREFPYPADYTPPQIPQNQGSGINPAIPATPSFFKKRDVGVRLEVAPKIRSDNASIELVLSPEIVSFQGFVNYGTPVYTQAPVFFIGQTNAVLSTEQVLLTKNIINQPIFSIRQVTTDVILHDGQTVVLGGLMREDMQQINNKVPILGSIPFLGSLFCSSSKQKIKQNLIIFVTVHLINTVKK